MRMFTVYRNPKDFPDKWVVRECAITEGAVIMAPDPLYVGDSLREARDSIVAIFPGAYRIEREINDEAQVVEVWL